MAELTISDYDATDDERETVERLLRESDGRGRSGSVTRTAAGNTGPLRVEAGGQAWLVDEDGNAHEIEPAMIDTAGQPVTMEDA